MIFIKKLKVILTMQRLFVKIQYFILSIFSIILLSSFEPFKIIPPGTVRFNDTLFVDITEIRNLDWKEYSYWQKAFYGEKSNEYKSCFPDSTIWRTSIYEQVAKSYFKHPAYNEFPIVGITFEQAQAYCEWRTKQVNYMNYIRQNKLPFKLTDDTTGIKQIYVYRLPTVAEWEAIASLGFSPKTKKAITSKKNFNPNVYNLIYPEYVGKNSTNAVNLNSTAEVKSFWANAIGCYNIFGNVAEMTNEKGIAKGGSWLHNANDVVVNKNFYYKGSQNWLGFRCICVKVLKSDKEIANDSIKALKIERKLEKEHAKAEKMLNKTKLKTKNEDEDED